MNDRVQQMLDDIEQRQQQDKFLMALTRILERHPPPYEKGVLPPFLWLVLRATPEEITEAYTQVVK